MLRRPRAQSMYGGLRAADGAQRSEADQPGHDEVDGDEVIGFPAELEKFLALASLAG